MVNIFKIKRNYKISKVNNNCRRLQYTSLSKLEQADKSITTDIDDLNDKYT